MARSWSEISSGEKLVYFLEGRLRKRDVEGPVGCRFCSQIFVTNVGLVLHFLSEHSEDWTLKLMPHGGTSVSRENGKILSSRSPFSAFSSTVQVNGSGSSVSRNDLRPGTWQVASSNPPGSLVSGNYIVPTSLHHSVRSRPHHPVFKRPRLSYEPQVPDTVPRSSGIALGASTAPHLGSNWRDVVRSAFHYRTKPYIFEIGQPNEEKTLNNNEKGCNLDVDDEIDLTLKL